jgi:hypothetical protein
MDNASRRLTFHLLFVLMFTFNAEYLFPSGQAGWNLEVSIYIYLDFAPEG